MNVKSFLEKKGYTGKTLSHFQNIIDQYLHEIKKYELIITTYYFDKTTRKFIRSLSYTIRTYKTMQSAIDSLRDHRKGKSWVTLFSTEEKMKSFTVLFRYKIKSKEEECEHPFYAVSSKCNGEINYCYKCGKNI